MAEEANRIAPGLASKNRPKKAKGREKRKGGLEPREGPAVRHRRGINLWPPLAVIGSCKRQQGLGDKEFADAADAECQNPGSASVLLPIEMAKEVKNF